MSVEGWERSYGWARVATLDGEAVEGRDRCCLFVVLVLLD
jgi:hypothetical protein